MIDIPEEIAKKIAHVENTIGYTFTDKTLIGFAITHVSSHEGINQFGNNERLEFLGDRVLGLLTAHALYQDTHTHNEGEMARILNNLVNKKTCAQIARKIDLGSALILSASETRNNGHTKNSILGDACEALLGALYIDGGLKAPYDFYEKFWLEEVSLQIENPLKDPKTALQEKVHLEKLPVPIYEVIEQEGPAHRPIFVVEVTVEGFGAAQGTGKSKKVAETYAAQHLLENWDNYDKAPPTSLNTE